MLKNGEHLGEDEVKALFAKWKLGEKDYYRSCGEYSFGYGGYRDDFLKNKKVVDGHRKCSSYFNTTDFIDEWEVLLSDYLELLRIFVEKDEFVNIRSEVPITARNDFIIGYWDVVISIDGPRHTENLSMWRDGFEQGAKVFIEVKPKIDSFGKVLRQLSTYRHYIGEEIPAVVYLRTDDRGFEAAFRSQGIEVI